MIKRHHSIRAVHPGEMLREIVLPEVDMSKAEIARSLKISRQSLYDILSEKQSVTAEMAIKFGKFFGNGPNFWINLQKNYDLHVAEKSLDLSEIPTLGEHAA